MKTKYPFQGSRQTGAEWTAKVRVASGIVRDQANDNKDGEREQPERRQFMRNAAPAVILHHRQQLNRGSPGFLLGTPMRSNRMSDGAQTSIT